MRVAIIHYWFVSMRGGEKVVQELCAMFPDAVIFTHIYDAQGVTQEIRRHEVRETFIASLPFAKRQYKKYLPLMPYALEALDLREFDLVISSEAGPAKGVIPMPGAQHVCYCHSPMRYIWDQYHVYREQAGRATRLMMPLIAHKMRVWDVTTSARVDRFVANSNHVANRIDKYYRRPSDVIFPPVSIADFSPVKSDEVEDYYLIAGELVSYKRADIAIDAFNKSGKKLVVIGDGAERKPLEQKAKSNITFLGKVPFEQLKRHFAKCRALVFPGEEDFGMVPVEVMASGRPVIAYGKGGVLDTIIDQQTGALFSDQSVEGLIEAVDAFETGLLNALDQNVLQAHVAKFNPLRFRREFAQILTETGVAIDDIQGLDA